MPNHVKNVVKMEGITNLPLFVEEDGVRCFDFNKMIPMPESLKIESGSMTDECIMYYLTDRCEVPVGCLDEEKKEIAKKLVNNMFSEQEEWLRKIFYRAMERAYKKSEAEKVEMYENGKIYLNNYVNYGCTTWYEWCTKNWGTKWNAYSNEQRDENTIEFETAWSNPEPVMLKLSEMYPDVTIEHWWADEDMGSNDGYRVYRGGSIVEGDYCDSCSSEAYETYAYCWGESECIYKDDEGEWQRRNCSECHGCD